MIYLIGFYIFFTLLFSVLRKNNTFNSFKNGIKDGISIVLNMFHILLIFSLCITCINNCGIIEQLNNKYNNFGFINIIIQLIIRPLSSGSSYTILLNIYKTYGIDSFYGILSTFIHSTCDTLFYIISIYSSYAKIKLSNKHLLYGVIVVIFSYILIFIICFSFFN